ERERAQAELTRAVHELELANQRKNEFLATLAHELRTPLSPIALGMDLLSELVPQQAEVERVLSAMKRQSRHLVRLVDDLLEVSRISRGKIQLQRGPLSLADAVEQAEQMCRPLFEEREHTLDVEVAAEPLYLDADRVRLTQVIANLLTNAARYTPPHGKIKLVTRQEGETALVEVIDNGRGMTPELIGRVFDIFEQGEGGEESSGLGIGLALVKHLVALHGGKVEAHSDGPDLGSTFRVSLPLVAAELVREQQLIETGVRMRSAANPARRLEVLLVEDNEDIRELTSCMLERAGHQVETAQDGPSALELARARSFDVALVDIGLPGMGGVEVGAELRKLCGPSTRLVAVTGYGHAEVRADAAQAGFDAYLIKPVAQQELDIQLALAGSPPPTAVTG
ncbi:MAG TPA: ATP-binding protein, partial [Polyangiales bacterium]